MAYITLILLLGAWQTSGTLIRQQGYAAQNGKTISSLSYNAPPWTVEKCKAYCLEKSYCEGVAFDGTNCFLFKQRPNCLDKSPGNMPEYYSKTTAVAPCGAPPPPHTTTATTAASTTPSGIGNGKCAGGTLKTWFIQEALPNPNEDEFSGGYYGSNCTQPANSNETIKMESMFDCAAVCWRKDCKSFYFKEDDGQCHVFFS